MLIAAHRGKHVFEEIDATKPNGDDRRYAAASRVSDEENVSAQLAREYHSLRGGEDTLRCRRGRPEGFVSGEKR